MAPGEVWTFIISTKCPALHSIDLILANSVFFQFHIIIII